MNKAKPDPILFLDDHRGIYIPRDFAACVVRERVTGISNEQYADLGDPDSPAYWDTWADVCDHATLRGDGDVEYRLYQDGALWLVPAGMEWDDDTGFFTWAPDAVETVEEGADDRTQAPAQEVPRAGSAGRSEVTP